MLRRQDPSILWELKFLYILSLIFVYSIGGLYVFMGYVIFHQGLVFPSGKMRNQLRMQRGGVRRISRDVTSGHLIRSNTPQF